MSLKVSDSFQVDKNIFIVRGLGGYKARCLRNVFFTIWMKFVTKNSLVFRIGRVVFGSLHRASFLHFQVRFGVLKRRVWCLLLLFFGHNFVVRDYFSQLGQLYRTLRGYVIPFVTGVADDLLRVLVYPTHWSSFTIIELHIWLKATDLPFFGNLI